MTTWPVLVEVEHERQVHPIFRWQREVVFALERALLSPLRRWLLFNMFLSSDGQMNGYVWTNKRKGLENNADIC